MIYSLTVPCTCGGGATMGKGEDNDFAWYECSECGLKAPAGLVYGNAISAELGSGDYEDIGAIWNAFISERQQHSATCNKMLAEAQAYTGSKNYCKACGGTGTVSSYDFNTGYDDIDDCRYCIQKGLCPMCQSANMWYASDIKGPMPENFDAVHSWCCMDCHHTDDDPPPAFMGYLCECGIDKQI